MTNHTSVYTENDLVDAKAAIKIMAERAQKAQAKFSEGSSQHTLQVNRIHALQVALQMIDCRISNSNISEMAPEDIQRAKAPLQSLLSKSEKSCTKLVEGSWQYKMLSRNIVALSIAVSAVCRNAEVAIYET